MISGAPFIASLILFELSGRVRFGVRMTLAYEKHLFANLDAIAENAVAIRHDLHRYPQVGYEETYASGLIRKELTRLGIEHKSGYAGGRGSCADSGTAGVIVRRVAGGYGCFANHRGNRVALRFGKCWRNARLRPRWAHGGSARGGRRINRKQGPFRRRRQVDFSACGGGRPRRSACATKGH